MSWQGYGTVDGDEEAQLAPSTATRISYEVQSLAAKRRRDRIVVGLTALLSTAVVSGVVLHSPGDGAAVETAMAHRASAINALQSDDTNFGLADGQAIKCSADDPQLYRMMNNERHLYPSTEVAAAWDPNWSDFVLVDCTDIPVGEDMAMPEPTTSSQTGESETTSDASPASSVAPSTSGSGSTSSNPEPSTASNPDANAPSSSSDVSSSESNLEPSAASNQDDTFAPSTASNPDDAIAPSTASEPDAFAPSTASTTDDAIVPSTASEPDAFAPSTTSNPDDAFAPSTASNPDDAFVSSSGSGMSSSESNPEPSTTTSSDARAPSSNNGVSSTETNSDARAPSSGSGLSPSESYPEPSIAANPDASAPSSGSGVSSSESTSSASRSSLGDGSPGPPKEQAPETQAPVVISEPWVEPPTAIPVVDTPAEGSDESNGQPSASGSSWPWGATNESHFDPMMSASPTDAPPAFMEPTWAVSPPGESSTYFRPTAQPPNNDGGGPSSTKNDGQYDASWSPWSTSQPVETEAPIFPTLTPASPTIPPAPLSEQPTQPQPTQSQPTQSQPPQTAQSQGKGKGNQLRQNI